MWGFRRWVLGKMYTLDEYIELQTSFFLEGPAGRNESNLSGYFEYDIVLFLHFLSMAFTNRTELLLRAQAFWAIVSDVCGIIIYNDPIF